MCRSRGATPSAPPGMSLLRDQFRCPRTSAMETSHRAPAGSDAAVLRADAGPLPPHGLHCVWNGHAPVDRSSHTGPSWRIRANDRRAYVADGCPAGPKQPSSRQHPRGQRRRDEAAASGAGRSTLTRWLRARTALTPLLARAVRAESRRPPRWRRGRQRAQLGRTFLGWFWAALGPLVIGSAYARRQPWQALQLQ